MLLGSETYSVLACVLFDCHDACMLSNGPMLMYVCLWPFPHLWTHFLWRQTHACPSQGAYHLPLFTCPICLKDEWLCHPQALAWPLLCERNRGLFFEGFPGLILTQSALMCWVNMDALLQVIGGKEKEDQQSIWSASVCPRRNSELPSLS